ncbi:MAG: FecR family protein [Elusimicrobiota bacterium]
MNPNKAMKFSGLLKLFCIVLSIVSGTIFIKPVSGEKASPYPSAKKYYTACIYKSSGRVEVYDTTSKTWMAATKYMPIEQGNRVKTFKGASCDVVMNDGSTLRISENTDVDFSVLSYKNKKQKYKINITAGKILGLLGKIQTSGSYIKLKTPTAVMAVRGTDFSIVVSSEKTNVGLFEGALAVKPADEDETESETGEDAQEPVPQMDVSTQPAPVKQEEIPGNEVLLEPGKEVVVERGHPPLVEERLSRFMEKEKERWLAVREYVEGIRKRLQERESYLQERIQSQKSSLEKWEQRRQEKLRKEKP